VLGNIKNIVQNFIASCGPGIFVGIATDFGLDGPGIEHHGARFFAVQTGPGAYPASCTMGTGVKSGRDVTLTPHPILVPRYKNRVELYLYSP